MRTIQSRMLLFTSALLLWPLGLAAQAPRPAFGPGFAGRAMKMRAHRGLERHWLMLLHAPWLRAKLQLTPAQISQLRSIGFAARRSAIQLRAKIALSRLDLRQAFAAHQATLEAMNQKLEAIGQLRTQARIARADALWKARAVLTPAQRQLIHRFLARQRMRMLRMRRMMWLRRHWGHPMPPAAWHHPQPRPKQQQSEYRVPAARAAIHLSALALPSLPPDWRPVQPTFISWTAQVPLAPPPAPVS